MTHVGDALRGLKLGAQEIANKSHLLLSRVDAILGGEKASLAEVRAISAGLRLPMHVLAKGARMEDSGSELTPLFRRTGPHSEDFDITVERVASFVEGALSVLPSRNSLPNWLAELDATKTSYEEADRIAKKFRNQIFEFPEDEPANDLPNLIGSLEGIILSPLSYSKYEGVSLIAENYCFIFVSPRFSGRMLFTLGHEIGHLIAHHKYGSVALFESASQIGTFGAGSLGESFVDAFASCLLLPDVGVAKTLRVVRDHFEIKSKNLTDREILTLARFYGVSFEVAARRCEDLGLLPNGYGHALAAKVKTEFGSAEKRAEQLELPPRIPVKIPKISIGLAKALNRNIRAGEVSLGWASDRLGLSIGEILASNRRPQAS